MLTLTIACCCDDPLNPGSARNSNLELVALHPNPVG